MSDKPDAWTFLRGVLKRGEVIAEAMKHAGYEAYSAKMDAAAREYAAELKEIISAERHDEMIEQIEYVEGADALLDGTVPTTRTDADGTVVKLWLKDRVQLLLDQLESTADKLSECWLFIDRWARSQPADAVASARANVARELLTRQACPGWKHEGKR